MKNILFVSGILAILTFFAGHFYLQDQMAAHDRQASLVLNEAEAEISVAMIEVEAETQSKTGRKPTQEEKDAAKSLSLSRVQSKVNSQLNKLREELTWICRFFAPGGVFIGGLVFGGLILIFKKKPKNA